MKILNFGALNIDYIYSVDHFVRGGETLSSEDMKIFSGGKGLNQSIALSKSGAQVWHAGAIGTGDGEFLVEELKAAGVHTRYIRVLEGKSGHAIIQKASDGGNCILLYGGANQSITRAMVDEVMENFYAGDYLMLQNEVSEIGYMMDKAHEKGMKIILNPSPMDEKIKEYPLRYVDYFLLNEIEAGDICGSLGEWEELLAKLALKFPGAKIVLTLGEEGAVYRDQERVLHQKSFRVPVRDTTGAGDTFTGYFIGGLVQGLEAETALLQAAKAAAIAVSRFGAAPSIPDREEVEKFHEKELD